MPKVGPRSRFVTPPAADGSIHTETLGWPEVVALTSTTSLVRIEGKTVAAERIVFVYDPGRTTRSEEHTSELQSLMRISYAVFCLKKKKKTQPTYHYRPTKQNKKLTDIKQIIASEIYTNRHTKT